ncbi:MAG: hypothetical protein HY427_02020 [Candidatus Levybacteria bacterium]|nr:hypothetical protein [Candidatus Levybacteria bacterium]
MKVKTITFPRRITESLPQRLYFTNLFLLFLCVLFILSVILAANAYIAMTEAKGVRVEITDSFNYWRGITEKHPNSPDAFYEAGYYAAELGDKSKALVFLDEALRLDPSFEKAKALEKLIANGQ